MSLKYNIGDVVYSYTICSNQKKKELKSFNCVIEEWIKHFVHECSCGCLEHVSSCLPIETGKNWYKRGTFLLWGRIWTLDLLNKKHGCHPPYRDIRSHNSAQSYAVGLLLSWSFWIPPFLNVSRGSVNRANPLDPVHIITEISVFHLFASNNNSSSIHSAEWFLRTSQWFIWSGNCPRVPSATPWLLSQIQSMTVTDFKCPLRETK